MEMGGVTMAKVLIVESTYETCDNALEEVFQTFPMDLKGKKVCIKVNSFTAGDPHKYAFVTDYRFLKAVLKQVERLGPAEIVVGDSIGTTHYGKTEEVFEANRFKEVAGAYYKNFNKNIKFVEMEYPEKQRVLALKDVLEADVYISLPKMKTHALGRISGGVKNNFGLVAGLRKALFHYESITPEKFGRILAGCYQLRKPDLVIIDGIHAQSGYGPVSEEVYKAHKVIASTDGVATDVVFSDMIGLTVDEVPYLVACREESLGETDLAKIEVIGDTSLPEPWNVPSPAVASYIIQRGPKKAGIDFWRDRAAARPVIDMVRCATSEACARIGPACVKQCPSGALRGGQGDFRCKKDKCLQCTSCMEWCPVRAVTMPPDPELIERLKQHEKAHYPVFPD